MERNPSTSAQRRREDGRVRGSGSESAIGSCTDWGLCVGERVALVLAHTALVVVSEQARHTADDANGEHLDVVIAGRWQRVKVAEPSGCSCHTPSGTSVWK